MSPLLQRAGDGKKLLESGDAFVLLCVVTAPIFACCEKAGRAQEWLCKSGGGRVVGSPMATVFLVRSVV